LSGKHLIVGVQVCTTISQFVTLIKHNLLFDGVFLSL
jgi:hypothetical protein